MKYVSLILLVCITQSCFQREHNVGVSINDPQKTEIVIENDTNCVISSVEKEPDCHIINKEVNSSISNVEANNAIQIKKDIIGTWKLSGDKNKTAIIASNNSFGYLDIYINDDYARVLVDVDSDLNFKYSSLTSITMHNKFVNWSDISNDSVVFRVKNNEKDLLVIEWLGFYNNKTKKREMIENPFTKIYETGSIVLERY